MMALQTALLIVIGTLLSSTFDLASGAPGKAALLIVDMQDSFVSGNMKVDGANEVTDAINSIRDKHEKEFTAIALSKTMHPIGHVSLQSSFPSTISPIKIKYNADGQLCTDNIVTVESFPDAVSCEEGSETKEFQQQLWEDHCMINVTSGPTSSATVPALNVKDIDLIIRMGTKLEMDSYSAFFDIGASQGTGLHPELQAIGITHVFVTGLAADMCVYYTSLDAKKLGYETYYVVNATKPLFPSSLQKAVDDMIEKDIHIVSLDGMAQALKDMVKVKVLKSASSCLSCLPLASILPIGWLATNL